MKKILVIGCPGSGKSTFSKALHNVTGIPLIHLDNLFWNADQTTVEQSVFREKLAAVLQEDAWIIDGNYGSTLEMRMQACDTVIFLDIPPDVCLEGVCERKGTARSDLPWVETEEDPEFTAYIRGFPTQGRPQILRLLERYADKEHLIFTDRSEADVFLETYREQHPFG